VEPIAEQHSGGRAAEAVRGQVAPLVVHVFPTFAVGGAQVRFAAIANHFGAAFRHMVVSLDGDLTCRSRLRPDLDVIYPEVGAPKGSTLVNAWRFRRLLRQWRPDVLVTCNWGAIEFAMANMLPVTRHLHVVDGFGPEERSRQLRRRVLLRRIVLSRTPVVLPSRSLVSIATEIWKLPPEMIRYVPNGVDLTRFAPTEAVDDAEGASVAETAGTAVRGPTVGVARSDGVQPASEVPVIGTIAALREEKNIPRLLRAFALVVADTPARLVIVGDGPERPRLAALAAELGIADRVEFAGQREDTPSFYARFDVFALSSDTEQMPFSVIEAMASRLPVVATDVGDVATMLAQENAPFVTRPDDTALAAALRTLLSNELMRYDIGAANLSKAQRDFDAAAMFAAHGALWRGAADRS
jgi:glycosyltransferase involved in cell wall biosynthesis